MQTVTNPASAEATPHVTKRQVAARYCVTPETIDNWVRSKPGFPAPLRLARKALWRLEDLLAFEARAVGGPTDA
jgi:hypothetical protein